MRFPAGFAGSLITASAVIDVARPDTFVALMEGRVRREMRMASDVLVLSLTCKLPDNPLPTFSLVPFRVHSQTIIVPFHPTKLINSVWLINVQYD